MNKQDKQGFVIVLAAALVLAAWGAIGTADAQDAENAHRVHCEAVVQWHADARAGVGPAQRRGWPNYDGRACE